MGTYKAAFLVSVFLVVDVEVSFVMVSVRTSALPMTKSQRNSHQKQTACQLFHPGPKGFQWHKENRLCQRLNCALCKLDELTSG